MKDFAGKHILIIVENLPVPFDRRVWKEANTLAEHGAQVSIICPIMKGYTKKYEVINGIEIYRHPLPPEARGAMGYILEYTVAMYWEFWISWKIFFKKRFHVIHGCNPPDLIFLIAWWFRPFGVKYLFDHHDLNPELFIAKFNKKGFYYQLMLLLEFLTFKTASYSIATNESYKEIAIRRGKMKAEDILVVRSGPKLDRLILLPPDEKYKKSRKYMVGYVGVIGEQEGIDLLLESARYITERRDDVQFAILGGGTDVEKLQKMSIEMGLEQYVDFYGRVSDEILISVLNTADVCVNPDKPSEMNDLSTMNKIMEYMALKKPIVQYDLKEGRFSAQESSLYAENNNTIDFAEKIIYLLDHQQIREEMGEFGYDRVINELSWEYESKKLITVYKKILGIN